MINVEEQLDVRAAHAVDQLRPVAHVVEEVSGVIHVGVQDFDDGRNPVFLEHRRGRAQGRHSVRHLLRARHSAQLVPGQRHELRAAHFLRGVNREARLTEELLPFAGIHQAAARRRHALVPYQALANQGIFLPLGNEGFENFRIAPVEHLISVVALASEQGQRLGHRHPAEHPPRDRESQALRAGKISVRRRDGCGRARSGGRDSTGCEGAGGNEKGTAIHGKPPMTAKG